MMSNNEMIKASIKWQQFFRSKLACLKAEKNPAKREEIRQEISYEIKAQLQNQEINNDKGREVKNAD